MTTVVYLGDRILADTRSSIKQEGFLSESGDKTLCNDQTIKLVPFSEGHFWDGDREIQMVGAAGTVAGRDSFVRFLKKLQCPLKDFLKSMEHRERHLYNILSLQTPSTFILCLDDGSSVKVFFNDRLCRWIEPNTKVKACGSGAFYFDAIRDLFEIDPVTLFRLSITTDKSSSSEQYIEAVYNSKERTWTLDKTIKRFEEPLDPEVLINSLHPNVKAMFRTTLNALDKVPQEVVMPDEDMGTIPVKIPATKRKES